jgi:hypothetical protein
VKNLYKQTGVFLQTDGGISRLSWEALLRDLGLAVRGHRLMRTRDA